MCKKNLSNNMHAFNISNNAFSKDQTTRIAIVSNLHYRTFCKLGYEDKKISLYFKNGVQYHFSTFPGTFLDSIQLLVLAG